MAQGQIKKAPSSQLVKGKRQVPNNKLSKGGTSSPCLPCRSDMGGAKVFKSKNTTIRKGQMKQEEITKHINRKNELELASRAASIGGSTGTSTIGRFTILKGLVKEGKKQNESGIKKKKQGKVKSGSKR